MKIIPEGRPVGMGVRINTGLGYLGEWDRIYYYDVRML